MVLRWSMERIPATLRITSPNLGAVVTVDDLDVGAVPVEVQRPAGRYRVTVRKPRYDPYQTQIEASPGQETSLNVPLKHKYEIERRWWFWSALVVGAAAVVVPIVATRPGPSPDLGGLQWLSKP